MEKLVDRMQMATERLREERTDDRGKGYLRNIEDFD